MTDELMDERLQAAGRRWRDAHPTVAAAPRADDELLPPPHVPARRWMTVASAAIVAAALIIGGIVLAANRGDGHGRAAAAPNYAAALTGRTWTLSGDPASTLSFTRNTVSIDAAGCLRFTVATTVEAHHIVLGKQIGNEVPCAVPGPGAATDHLNRITGILSGRLTWSVSGDRLTLTKSDGSTIGTLVYTSAGVGDLTGVTWTDQEVGATVVFTADTARTYDGCSNALYAVTVDNHRLSLGKQIGTAGVCTGTPAPRSGPDDRVTFDRQAAALAKFYTVLHGPSEWSVEAQTLTLTSSTGASVTLTTDVKPAPRVVDSHWVLERVITGTSGELPGSYSSAGLAFDASGGFTANDLCNTLSGRAKATDDSIVFSDVAITAMACIDPAFTPATSVIDKVVLSGATTYSIRGTELIISTDHDGQLVYVPAANADQPTADPAALTAHAWLLTGTETTTSNSGSASSAAGLSRVEFHGKGGFTVRHRCYTNKGNAEIGLGTAQLRDVTLKLAHRCPAYLNGEQAEDGVVDSVLDGAVTWSIRGDQLTITKDGVGRLVFTGA